MPVLTVRISEEEKTMLARRARKEGVKSAALVRKLINEAPFVTGADLLAEAELQMGNKKLRIKRRS